MTRVNIELKGSISPVDALRLYEKIGELSTTEVLSLVPGHDAVVVATDSSDPAALLEYLRSLPEISEAKSIETAAPTPVKTITVKLA